jgi:outer membrane protein OmpA-like peptidoglycan-associated protein
MPSEDAMKLLDLDRSRDRATEEDASSPARLDAAVPRRIARNAAGSSAGGHVAPEPESAAWSFSDAINAGIHAPIARAAESSGHGLPDGLRAKFEASLGEDLGGVRVHADSAAAEASAALGARAYAVGQDVFMGAGQYAPDTTDGAWLLAHEVAHTVQQRGAAAGPQAKLEVSEPGDAMEHEADAAANAMMHGQPATVTAATGVARKIMRHKFPFPMHRTGHSPMHFVEMSPLLAVFPSQGAADVRVLNQLASSVNVMAGSTGRVVLRADATYFADVGGFTEGMLGVAGEFGFYASWQFSCHEDGVVALALEGDPQFHSNRGGMKIGPFGTLLTAKALATVVEFDGQKSAAMDILFSKNADETSVPIPIPKVPGAKVDGKVVTGADDSGALNFRIRLVPVGAHAPVPPPAPTPPPDPHALPSFLRSIVISPFEEGKADIPSWGTNMVTHWAHDLPPAVRKAIHDKRVRIEVKGYASQTGADSLNEGLSQKRAENVAALVRMRLVGAGNQDLVINAFGKTLASNLKNPDGTAISLPQDRRVEIEVIGD